MGLEILHRNVAGSWQDVAEFMILRVSRNNRKEWLVENVNYFGNVLGWPLPRL
jgi:hypothetical protein